MLLYYFVPEYVFANIITTKKLWMQTVNPEYRDTEINLSPENYVKLLDECAPYLEKYSKFIKVEMGRMIEFIENAHPNLADNILYISTTECNTDGRHWFKYAGEAKGICLVLDSEVLDKNSICGNNQVHLVEIGRMMYRQKDLAKTFAAEICRILDRQFPYSNFLCTLYAGANILIKDDDFDWAKEVRIYAYKPDLDSWKIPRTYESYIPTADGMIKETISAMPDEFLAADLKNKGAMDAFVGSNGRIRHEMSILHCGNECAIKGVVLGKYCGLTDIEVSQMLKDHGWPEIPISRSDVEPINPDDN